MYLLLETTTSSRSSFLDDYTSTLAAFCSTLSGLNEVSPDLILFWIATTLIRDSESGSCFDGFETTFTVSPLIMLLRFVTLYSFACDISLYRISWPLFAAIWNRVGSDRSFFGSRRVSRLICEYDLSRLGAISSIRTEFGFRKTLPSLESLSFYDCSGICESLNCYYVEKFPWFVLCSWFGVN